MKKKENSNGNFDDKSKWQLKEFQGENSRLRVNPKTEDKEQNMERAIVKKEYGVAW